MNNRQIVGSIIILFGLSFLFEFPFINILFSLIIIYFGVRVLTGNTGDLPFRTNIETNSTEDFIKRVLVFSGLKIANESKNFRGAELVTVFGEGEIDLSKVSSKDQQLEINLVAVFGVIRLIVPKNWDISTEGVGILGTFYNRTAKPSEPETKVHIEGAAILGQITISS